MSEDSLQNFIQGIYPLPPDILTDLSHRFEKTELPKGYFLLREGNHCSSVWFLETGLARLFFVDEKGKEINTWFFKENNFIVEMFSLVNTAKSKENIQLIEDSVVYQIKYPSFVELQEKEHEFCKWYIRLIESYYINAVEQRLEDVQFLDAKARYTKLLSTNPDFLNRISLGNLSSFLGITQESLSRIRRKQ